MPFPLFSQSKPLFSHKRAAKTYHLITFYVGDIKICIRKFLQEWSKQVQLKLSEEHWCQSLGIKLQENSIALESQV